MSTKRRLKMHLQFFASKAQTNQDKAQETWHQAKSLMDDYEGKEMPKDVEEKLDRLFADVDLYQKKAEREIKSKQNDDYFNNPVHKHPLAELTPEEMEKKGKREHQDLFRTYYRKGKSAIEPEHRKTLSSLSDPEGGFLVPEDFRAELIRKRRDLVQIRQVATVLETNSASVGFPVFDYDGDAEWTAESAQIAEDDVMNAFGKQTFVPHKLARILRIPMELLEDAVINVESLMSSHFAQRFAEIEENAFIQGDGVNKPLGLLEAGLPETDATGGGGTFVADDLFDTVYNIRAVYRNNAQWLMHRNGVRKVRKFKDSDGQYLWQPALTAGQPATLLSYPIYESEFFPDNVDSGSAGDPLAVFGDHSWYWIVDRVGMSVQRLTERYAEYDQVGLKMRMRTDGSPVKSDPFQVLVRI